jgi:hypothetical protein
MRLILRFALAASLMTLISLVMVMGFVLRMRRVARADGSMGKEEDRG